MCASPSFTILSDHSTYRCRPRWSSTTGNWAGAPGRASTGCSEGGNLQGEGSHAVKSFPQPSPGITAGSSSLIYQHHVLLTFSSTEVDGRHQKKCHQTGQTCQNPHQRGPRMDQMDSHPGKKKKRRDFSQGVSVLCVVS